MTMRDDIAKRMGEYRNKSARSPFVKEGVYTLTLKQLRKQAEQKTAQGVGPDGKPALFTFEQVKAYFLDAEVVTSSRPDHPVGSTVAVYYSMLPNAKTKVEDGDEKALQDLFFAVLECCDKLPGKSPTAEELAEVEKLYGEFKSDPSFVEGVRIGLEARPKADRKGDDSAFCYKNWRPIRGQGAAPPPQAA